MIQFIEKERKLIIFSLTVISFIVAALWTISLDAKTYTDMRTAGIRGDLCERIADVQTSIREVRALLIEEMRKGRYNCSCSGEIHKENDYGKQKQYPEVHDLRGGDR